MQTSPSEVSQLVSPQRCWTAVSIQSTPSASLLFWGKTTPVSAGASDYGSEGWGLAFCRYVVTF